MKRKKDVAVLFILIGWASKYDGNESIVGGHNYLKDHPEENTELKAFVRQKDGRFHCGVGRGRLNEEKLDGVFIARHPETQAYEIVAIYLSAIPIQESKDWSNLACTEAIFFMDEKRPKCNNWPVGRGMRRWAQRVNSSGSVHSSLLVSYKEAIKGRDKYSKYSNENSEFELTASEGELTTRLIAHRKREFSLRKAKILQALQAGRGKLKCEVPGCGFDFFEKYGKLGESYAVVHHIKPLASLSEKGDHTKLTDLVVVCANCHAMIHRGGKCRSLDSLILK